MEPPTNNPDISTLSPEWFEWIRSRTTLGNSVFILLRKINTPSEPKPEGTPPDREMLKTVSSQVIWQLMEDGVIPHDGRVKEVNNEWISWIQAQTCLGLKPKAIHKKAWNVEPDIPKGNIPSISQIQDIQDKYNRHRSRNWATGTKSSSTFDPDSITSTEAILPEETQPKADINVWRKVIAALIRRGDSDADIIREIRTKEGQTTAIAPTNKETRVWIQQIRIEVANEPEPVSEKKAPVEPPKPALRKVPPTFGFTGGQEFANVPGWILPEYRNGREAKDIGTEADPAPTAEKSYSAYGTLLMYAVLNYWNGSKIDRFLSAYLKLNPAAELPDDTTLQNWMATTLVDLKFPPLGENDTRESAGFVKAIQIFKKHNPWPETPAAFAEWNPASQDYSGISFDPEDD